MNDVTKSVYALGERALRSAGAGLKGGSAKQAALAAVVGSAAGVASDVVGSIFGSDADLVEGRSDVVSEAQQELLRQIPPDRLVTVVADILLDTSFVAVRRHFEAKLGIRHPIVILNAIRYTLDHVEDYADVKFKF